MSASRSATNFSQLYKTSSRRGLELWGDMAWEMFPEKTEYTAMNGNIDKMVNNDRRTVLRDEGPETSGLLPFEEARRDVQSRQQLNLRYLGQRYDADPLISHNGFSISFMDHDPRGTTTEANWPEYRRNVEARYRLTDFKDDSDYSETSGGWHPNTLYRAVRGTQEWFKTMFKNFDESYGNLNNGGVGVYDNVSKVYNSDREYNVIAETNGDPELKQHHNVNISNITNMGSKFLRVNTTPDQKVFTSAYGKLYKQAGLTPLESQMRQIEDDTPKYRGPDGVSINRNLVKMMANSVYNDNPELSPRTASSIGRILMQATSGDKERFGGGKDREQENRSRKLTEDIVSLMGLTEQDMKFMQSNANKNNKQATEKLANLVDMVIQTHRLPIAEKMKIRDSLMLHSLGTPKDRYIGHETVVNPKIIQFMDNQVRSGKSGEDTELNREESQTSNKTTRTLELFVTKQTNPADTMLNMYNGANTTNEKGISKNTPNYGSMTPKDQLVNAGYSGHGQLLASSTQTQDRSNMERTTNYNDMTKHDISMDFQNANGRIRRGQKARSGQLQKEMLSDYKYDDVGSDILTPMRKARANVN